MNTKNTNQLKILSDIFFGSIFIGFISYATIQFDTNPEYLKIIAYLWAVPLLYFYFVYIIYPKGNKALKNFTIHGIFGSLLTFILMIITLIMINYNINIKNIILFNIIYGIITLYIYFYYKLYLKF